MTVTWHVDDLKVSHKSQECVDEFGKWLQDKYEKLADVSSTEGTRHRYLGMYLDYSKDGAVMIDMKDYMHS